MSEPFIHSHLRQICQKLYIIKSMKIEAGSADNLNGRN